MASHAITIRALREDIAHVVHVADAQGAVLYLRRIPRAVPQGVVVVHNDVELCRRPHTARPLETISSHECSIAHDTQTRAISPAIANVMTRHAGYRLNGFWRS